MASFGEVLKRERELRQITLREVAEATKINLRYLEALERDDFRHLPGGVFNKGFVRAYAHHIGIDADSMVDAYLAEERDQQARTQAHTTESHRRAVQEPDFGDTRGLSPRRLLLALGVVIAALVVGLLGFLYWKGILDPARWLRRAGPTETAPSETISSDLGGRSESGAETSQSAAPAPGIPASPAPSAPAVEPRASAEPRPIPENPPPGSVAGGQGFDAGFAATVVLLRATKGSARCDDGEATSFDAVAVGGSVELRCREFLEVQAEDGGAIRVGLDGTPPAPIGADGAAVYGLRIRRAMTPPRPPAGGAS